MFGKFNLSSFELKIAHQLLLCRRKTFAAVLVFHICVFDLGAHTSQKKQTHYFITTLTLHRVAVIE